MSWVHGSFSLSYIRHDPEEGINVVTTWKAFKAYLCLFLAALMVLPAAPVRAQQTESTPMAEAALIDEGAANSTSSTDSESNDASKASPDAPAAAAAVTEPDGGESGLGVSAAPPGVSGFTGAASYQFPIPVPPGRAGIAPNLALTYNSQAGNGRLGVGWNLDLGSIQRRTKDGLKYGVDDFIATINGSQAELVARPPEWGADTFGSKIEGAFMRFRITARDVYNQPVSWEVTTKEGTKYFYGSIPSYNSKQVNSLGTFRWFLDKVVDLSGNTMTISYSLDNSVPYPTTIQYTGWEGSPAIAPSNRVEFIYSDRTDQPISYVSYASTRLTNRLTSILVSCNTPPYGSTSQLAARYDLIYSPSYSSRTSRSILTSIQRHETADSTTPLVETTFDWLQGNNELQDETFFGSHSGDYANGSGGFRMADVNGDGRADLIYAPSGSYDIKVIASNAEGGFDPEQTWNTHLKWLPS